MNMSWHREGGDIVVNKDCEGLVHTNLQFQMGTMRRSDGKLIVIDHSILYLCGKENKQRKFFGRRSSEEVTFREPFRNVMKMVRRGTKAIGPLIHLCPMDKQKCRFWNDAFYVCSIARDHEAKMKENTPCSTGIEKKKM